MKMNKFSSSVKHLKIRKGDKVKILLGKDRGKEGNVAYVKAGEGKVFVEGANLYKRSLKAEAFKSHDPNAKGQIIDLPKPMDISNVGLICPNCNKVTRIGFKIVGSEKLRICKKCKKEIKK